MDILWILRKPPRHSLRKFMKEMSLDSCVLLCALFEPKKELNKCLIKEFLVIFFYYFFTSRTNSVIYGVLFSSPGSSGNKGAFRVLHEAENFKQKMMDRIPSLSLTGLSLSHHPLSSLQSQNLATSTNSSTASLNQQALNSLNFHHQQSNHSQNQLNQNLNHSIITSSNNVGQHHHHHSSNFQQQQQQLHSTNLNHHHQQLNGLLNNVGANG